MANYRDPQGNLWPSKDEYLKGKKVEETRKAQAALEVPAVDAGVDLPGPTKIFQDIIAKADVLQAGMATGIDLSGIADVSSQGGKQYIRGTEVIPTGDGGYSLAGKIVPAGVNVPDFRNIDIPTGKSVLEAPVKAAAIPGVNLVGFAGSRNYWTVDLSKVDLEKYRRPKEETGFSVDVFDFGGRFNKVAAQNMVTFGAPTTPTPTPTPAAPPITPIKPITPTEDLDVTGAVTPAIATPKAPKILENFTTGLLADLGNKRKALDDLYTKQIEDIKTKSEALETKIADLTTKQEGVLETDVKPLLEPFREKLETSERGRLKLEENYFANQKSVQELETLLTTAMADIQTAKDVTGLAAIRNPRIAKLQTDTAARVGVIEAVMASRNNQITVAEGLIDRTTTAIEADRRDQLTYYESLLSFYEGKKDTAGEKLVSLSKDQKSFLEAQIGLLQSDLATSQESVNHIKGLLLDPSTAELAETAGIKLTDSIAEVNAKLAKGIATQSRQDLINEQVNEGYQHLSLPAQYQNKPEAEIRRVTDSQGNEMVFWKKAELETTTPDTREGIAIVEDTNTGKTYDLGTLEGLQDYKADNPDLSYEEIDAWMDINVTGLDATTRRSLLNAAGFPKTTGDTKTFDEIAAEDAQTIQKAKDQGIDKETSKLQLIGQYKSDLGLSAAAELPKQYMDLVDDILFAVYGGKWWHTFLPSKRGGLGNVSQADMRAKFGL